MLYPIIQRQIDLKWFQGDQDALRHPQRPRQAQPWRVQQVMLIKFDMAQVYILFFYY